MSDHDFCQVLLSLTMEEVRKHTTVAERKAAWTYKFETLGASVEFHGPDSFYWHGDGCCLWSARIDGWNAWMKSKGFEGEL